MEGHSKPLDNATAAAVVGVVALCFLAYYMDYYAFPASSVHITEWWQVLLGALPRTFFAFTGSRPAADGIAIALIAGTVSFLGVKGYHAFRLRVLLPGLARRMVSEEKILERIKERERERSDRPQAAGRSRGKAVALLAAFAGMTIGLLAAWLFSR